MMRQLWLYAQSEWHMFQLRCFTAKMAFRYSRSSVAESYLKELETSRTYAAQLVQSIHGL